LPTLRSNIVGIGWVADGFCDRKFGSGGDLGQGTLDAVWVYLARRFWLRKRGYVCNKRLMKVE